MSFFVYRKNNGALYSIGSEEPNFTRQDLAYVEIDGDVDDNTMWDEATLTLVPRPPKRHMDPEEFVARFTEEELQDLLTATAPVDAKAQALAMYLTMARVIELDGVLVQDGLDDLSTGGRISAARKQELTANV